MSAEHTSAVVAELTTRVTAHLHRWNLPGATSLRLLNVSENVTFLLSEPAGGEWVLRVHRVGYCSPAEIRSELAWMAALHRDGVMRTAQPLAGIDGEALQVLESAAGVPRHAVAFERLPGAAPDARDAAGWFERLGDLTARLHDHAQSWQPPRDFCRKRWDFEAMLGAHALWGPWRAAMGLDAAGAAILEEAVSFIQRRLARFGTDADRFGLVHADLRLANLLAHGSDLRIIDFDDCGFSWFLYDFATAVSFIEHEAGVAELLRAWCTGYARRRPLSTALRAEIPTLVVLRRILLTAWVASHAEIPFAREQGAGFTAGTVALAEELLRGRFLASAAG